MIRDENVVEASAAHSLEEGAPALEGARLLEVRVGLRPCRSEVRLASEVRPTGALVVHNYGHGGAGVSLSWGCAAEVLQLVVGEGSG